MTKETLIFVSLLSGVTSLIMLVMLVMGVYWLIRGKCLLFRHQVEGRQARIAGALFLSVLPLFLIIGATLDEVYNWTGFGQTVAQFVLGLIFIVCGLVVTRSYVQQVGYAVQKRSEAAPQDTGDKHPQLNEERRVEFTGTGFEALGWGLLATLLSLLIIPAAWGVVALYRWFVRNLSFSDGTNATFEGKGEQVWGYFAIAMLLGFVPQLSRAVEDPAASLLIALGLPILLLPISAAIWLRIIRWFFSNIRLSCGTSLNFNGNYGPYLGWMLLVSLSVFTIIGWAWALVAMLRWICRSIEAGQNHLEFVGDGWGLLWRSILAALASILIIPIPWVWLWVIRWVTGNMVIKQEVT